MLSLNRIGAMRNLRQEMTKYKVDIAALQEVRWKGIGIMDFRDYTLFNSGNVNKTFGTAFMVKKSMKHAVMNFEPVDERMCVMRIRGKFFNTTLICVHAPTEESEEEVKDQFYEKLEEVFDRQPRHDIKMIVGDMNAKVGREEIYRPTIGQHSIHETSNNNGVRLVDYAVSRNMTVSSTFFPHKRVHLETWMSPDGNTLNQIDHVLVERRYGSGVMDVRSYRGADCDSDHRMVLVRYRQRIANNKKEIGQKQKRFAVGKLKDEQLARTYSERLEERLQSTRAEVGTDITTEEQWNQIRSTITNTAEEVLGMQPSIVRAEWFDEECQQALDERNQVRVKMLQRMTRATKTEYQVKRREAKAICQRKKRELEKKRLVDMEEMYDKKEVRNFYTRAREMKRGFQPRTSFCRDRDGNLVGDVDGVMKRWVEYFETLLNLEDEEGEVNTVVEENQVIRYDEPQLLIEKPSLEEVNEAIKSLKNNKAPGEDGISSEMLKYSGKEMRQCIYKLLVRIWEMEEMPQEWNEAIICPLHKKGDKTNCGNFRGISLLNVTYKVFTKILALRLKPFVESAVGEYQCGFRSGRSTTDQIFLLRSIMEKCYEYNITLHQLFIDFKQAYDSVRRPQLYTAMLELGIPKKLVGLVEMTLRKTKAKVKVQGMLSECLEVKRGLRQGDVLSTLLFNVALEKVMRSVDSRRGGSIFSRTLQYLAYADDIAMIGRGQRFVSEGFSQMERESKKMGLGVNNEKTKYMIASRDHKIQTCLIVDNYNFERVPEFKYLGSVITESNEVQTEIKERILSANKCYYAFLPLLRSRLLTRRLKLRVYRVIIRPVIMYGAETWTLTKADENRIGVWERKILRKIFGAVKENEEWRIRTNAELKILYGESDLVTEIKRSRLRWLGHVQRMEDSNPVKKVFLGKPQGRRSRGRPRKRWLEDVEEDLHSMGVRGWRRKAVDRAEWANVIKEAKALQEL